MAETHAGHDAPNQFTRSLLNLERDDPRHAKSIELKLLSILKVRTGISHIQNDTRRHAAARLISGIDAAVQRQVIERDTAQTSKSTDHDTDKDLGR